jgi:hypothetical protein
MTAESERLFVCIPRKIGGSNRRSLSDTIVIAGILLARAYYGNKDCDVLVLHSARRTDPTEGTRSVRGAGAR